MKKNLYWHYDILRKPVITEKTTNLSESFKYVFEVAKASTKTLIKVAVEKVFEVKVKQVNVLNIKGKKKKFKGIKGVQSNVKKAVITLEKNYSIDFSGRR